MLYWEFVWLLERLNKLKTHLEVFKDMPLNVHQSANQSKSSWREIISSVKRIGKKMSMSSANNKNLQEWKYLSKSFITIRKNKVRFVEPQMWSLFLTQTRVFSQKKIIVDFIKSPMKAGKNSIVMCKQRFPVDKNKTLMN